MTTIDLPAALIEADDWMRDGACKGLTHLFFPTAAERPQARERRESAAQAICAGCSVRTQCMDFARDHHEYGFWGGESEDERHAAGFRLIAPIGVRARAADTFDVVVVGSLNLDLVARTPRLPGPGETVSGSDYQEFPGGKGLNQAVAAARAGASVAFVGAVGDDDAGLRLRGVVRHEGIDDRWLLTRADRSTGRALILVDDNAENSIVVIPGANADVWWPADGPRGAIVLAQLEVPMPAVDAAFAAAQATGATTILNPAPATYLPESIIATSSLIVPNEHEASLLGGIERLLGAGVEAVVTTLGKHGARVDAADGSFVQPPFPVEPADTTGAGDAFCGNLAARLAAGDDLATAVSWAGAAGALATTVVGAVPSLPRMEAVVERLGAA